VNGGTHLPRLVLVASHDDDMDLALHNHSPEVVDGVRQGPLAGDIRRGPAGPLDVVRIDVVATGRAGIFAQNHTTEVN